MVPDIAPRLQGASAGGGWVGGPSGLMCAALPMGFCAWTAFFPVVVWIKQVRQYLARSRSWRVRRFRRVYSPGAGQGLFAGPFGAAVG
jgi:hypothetical protein